MKKIIFLLIALIIFCSPVYAVQNSLVVPDGTGLAVRTGFNNSLQSLVTLFAGPTQPNPLYPYQFWIDTSTNQVMQANATATGSDVLGTLALDGTIQWNLGSGSGTVAVANGGTGLNNTLAYSVLSNNTATVGALSSNQTLKLGTPAITDTGILLQLTGNTNSYNQAILQNTNSGSAASADYIVNNNLGTTSTYYGDFGINSSVFTGSGSFNLPSASYLTSTSGDLALGTTTSNAIHFVVNSGATDAATISSAGVFSLGTPLAVGSGGTGATSLSGLATSGANSNITSLTGLTTALSIAQGGTAAITANGALTNLGAVSSTTLAATGAGNGGNIVGFIQNQTGAVAETVQKKNQDIISIMDFGAVGNGSTADDTAVAAAITAIGSNNVTLLIPNPIKIAANHYFPANVNLMFINGGEFVIPTGITLTLGAADNISATGQQQIFALTGTGAVAFGVGGQVYPEWFGAKGDGSTDDTAAIKAAVASLVNGHGWIHLGPKTYDISSVILIQTSYTGIVGAGLNSSILQMTSATGSGVEFLGTSGTHLANCYARQFSITHSSGALPGTGGNGLTLEYTSVARIEDMQIADFAIGVSLYGASNTLATRVQASNSSGSVSFHGFDIDTDVGCNSSEFRDCWVSMAGNTSTSSIGFYAYGANVFDLYFDECETASGATGFWLDSSASDSPSGKNQDITFMNCIADNYSTQGYYLYDFTNWGNVSIIGGWINAKAMAATTYGCNIQSCRGISITNVQFMDQNNATHCWGINALSSQNILVQGCLFTSEYYGIYATTCTMCSVIGNRFFALTGQASYFDIAFVTSSTNNIVNGNIMDGYSNGGGYFDSTSNNCIYTSNLAGANITTHLTNNSTGLVSANNI